MAAHNVEAEEIYYIADIARYRQTVFPSIFCEVPKNLYPAVVITAEHWEGGWISARLPVSATDVHHIFPVHASNVVILGIGRFRRKFLLSISQLLQPLDGTLRYWRRRNIIKRNASNTTA